MNSTLNSESKKQPIWAYVPADEFQLPASSIEETVKTGIVGLWQKLRPAQEETVTPFKARDELQLLSEALLDQIAAAPNWEPAATALAAVLDGWLDSSPSNQQPVVIVAPPHTNNAEILTLWAKRQQWRLIESPTADEILDQDMGWLEQLGADDTPWVLPALARCFLRHTQGLALIRSLFDRLGKQQLHPGVIGCDSWGWAYLQHIWPAPIPLVIRPQALTGEALAAWFQELAAGSKLAPILFRQQDNGKFVLNPPPELAGQVEGELGSSNFLKRLAAYSRGIPGIAWRLWRQSLLGEFNEKLSAEEMREMQQSQATTIWVRPWDQLKHPALPAEFGRDQAFIVHNLLLHNGLPAETVAQLLPLPATQVFRILYHLQMAGLVDQAAGWWTVSPLGYPVVRQFLYRQGYLTD